MTDSRQDLSPLQALLDACGAVIQEAKHHHPGGTKGARLPPALVRKLALLEEASGEAATTELKRISLMDDMLAERVNKETVIKMLDLHFDADNPDKSSFLIEAQPTEYILRFFGEMFAIALGDAPNYITTEMTLKGKGKELTDRYELTIKKMLGLSPREKYDDLLRRSQAFATQFLAFVNQECTHGFDHPPYENDLRFVAERLIKEEVKTPVAVADNLVEPEKFDIFKGLTVNGFKFRGVSPKDKAITFEHECGFFVRIGPHAFIKAIAETVLNHNCERDNV